MKNKYFFILFLALFCGNALATNIDSLFVVKIADEQLVDSTDQQRFDYYFFEAVRYRQQNNYNACKILLDSCNRLFPQQAAVHYEYFELYMALQDQDNALQNLQEAIKLAPDNDQYQEMYLNIKLSQKHLTEAIAGFEKLLEKHPAEEYYMRMLLDLYASTDNSSGVLRMLDRLEKTCGISEEISFQRMDVYLKRNKVSQVEKEMKKLIATYPLETRYLALLGQFYLNINKDKKALKCFNEALALDANDGTTLMSLAEYEESHGNTQLANEYMFKALCDKQMFFEEKAQWLFSYISALSQKQDTVQADSVFSALITVHPDEPDLYDFYGAYLAHFGRNERAKDAYRKAVELDPMLDNSWRQLYMLSDTAEIVQIVDEALQVFPKSDVWNMTKLSLFMSKEQYAEALVFIDQIKDIQFPNNVKSMIYGTRGDVLQRVGAQFDTIVWSYEQALQFDAQNTSAQNNYAYFLAENGGDLHRAETLSSAAVKASADNPTFLDTYAWVLFRQGEYRLAKFYQEKAVRLSEGEPLAELYEHYGDILYMLGNVDGAVEQWQRAQQCEGVSPMVAQKIAERKYIEK